MKILLTVSGGIDSMYMAERASGLFPGSGFAVAHCNFHLRGAESDADRDFVEEWCRTRGLVFHCTDFDTLAYAAANGLSTEMAARRLRYGWFRSLCRDFGYDAIAVAHNANDNAETLLLNLLRGTGTKGIRGMSEDSVMDGMRVLRPLLGTTRDAISEWMVSHGLHWREDRTNAESEYKRNKLRNLAFPVFSEINPSFVRTLGEDMERFRQVDDIAEEYFRTAEEAVLREAGAALPGTEGGRCGSPAMCIDVPTLLSFRHWKYVLWRLLEGCSFSAGTFGKLTALLERYRTEPSGTVTLSGKAFESHSHIVRAEKKTLIVREAGGLQGKGCPTGGLPGKQFSKQDKIQ